MDATFDLVAEHAHLVERHRLRIGQVPGDVTLARDDRAGVVAGGDDDVGPLDRVVVELVWDVIRGVDPDLAQHLEHLRVSVGARGATGRACLMAPFGLAAKQALGEQRAAGVPDADEEDVQAGSFEACRSPGWVSSPRTNW